jgi:hypothetical protein
LIATAISGGFMPAPHFTHVTLPGGAQVRVRGLTTGDLLALTGYFLPVIVMALKNGEKSDVELAATPVNEHAEAEISDLASALVARATDGALSKGEVDALPLIVRVRILEVVSNLSFEKNPLLSNLIRRVK